MQCLRNCFISIWGQVTRDRLAISLHASSIPIGAISRSKHRQVIDYYATNTYLLRQRPVSLDMIATIRRNDGSYVIAPLESIEYR